MDLHLYIHKMHLILKLNLADYNQRGIFIRCYELLVFHAKSSVEHFILDRIVKVTQTAITLLPFFKK